MPRPLEQFGGWLKFLFVTMPIGIAVITLYCFWYISLIVSGESIGERTVYLMVLLDMIIYLMLALKFVKIIKIKDVNIPERIIRIMTWMVIFTSVFGFCEITVSYLFFTSTATDFIAEIGKSIIRTVVFWLIWSNYFKKSRRVFSYYGKNAIVQFKI